MAFRERNMTLDLTKLHFSKRSRLTSILGLTLDGGHLEGVVLRRVNGSFQVQNSFSVALSLDPLTNAPELVGREIRNHLDAAEVRERNCVVGLPLKWVLTTHIELPELPEADIPSFLQIEAERGFPCDLETLHVATSRCRSASGKQHALLAGIPKTHLATLEQVLHAAKLKPVSFSLGITALQPAVTDPAKGVLALGIGETHVALEVSTGGGVPALRALEAAIEGEGSQRRLHADFVAREARITLGQLPADLRETIHNIRVFGPRDLAQALVDELDLRLDALGLRAEAVTRYTSTDFAAQIPAETNVSAAFSLAAHQLAGRKAVFELLPPKVSTWQQIGARYASGKMRSIAAVVGAVVLLVGALFFYQQLQLWKLERQRSANAAKVKQLTDIQKLISQYRPWFDEKVRGLSILRALTEAFPEDGRVTAKTVEIRDLHNVTCTGTARSYQDLLQTLQRLRGMKQFREANLGPTRGQAPTLQFSVTLAWNEGGSGAN
jgi:hypothetical protein